MTGLHKVYHIFPKGKFNGKVGATEDVAHRVEFQQGCGKEDYELVFASDDVLEASKAEIHHQKLNGYKLDDIPYHLLPSKLKYTENNNMIEIKKFKSPDWYSDYADRSMKELTAEFHGKGVKINGNVYTDTSIITPLLKLTQTSRYNGHYWSARAVDKLIADFNAKPEVKEEPKRQQNVCSDLKVSEQPFVNLNDVFEMQKSLQMKFPETANIGNETIAETAVAAQRNLHAFTDEMMEFMDALGGINDGIANGAWKYWKKDHSMAKTKKISDLSERDLKELKMEFVDMFHFFINWGLMIGMTGNEVIDYYVAKNKENFDRQERGY